MIDTAQFVGEGKKLVVVLLFCLNSDMADVIRSTSWSTEMVIGGGGTSMLHVEEVRTRRTFGSIEAVVRALLDPSRHPWCSP